MKNRWKGGDCGGGGGDRRNNERNKKTRFDSFEHQRHQQQQQQQQQQSVTNEQESDLPGFYYDAVKKKYFRIQANGHGVSSVVTKESIRSAAVAAQRERQPNAKCELLRFALDAQYGPSSSYLHIRRTSIRVASSNLNEICRFDQPISSIQIFDVARNPTPILMVNFSEPFDRSSFYQRFFSLPLDEPTTPSSPNELSVHGPNGSTQCPAYVRQGHLVTVSRDDASQQHATKLSISCIESTDHATLSLRNVATKRIHGRDVMSSALSDDLERVLIGLDTHVQLDRITPSSDHRNALTKLNTMRSSSLCVEFGNEQLIYAGCRNAHIYAYDLRVPSVRDFHNQAYALRTDSCLVDVKRHALSANYLFSSEFTGKVSLWDLRTQRVVNTYSDSCEHSSHRCRMALSACGMFIYLSERRF